MRRMKLGAFDGQKYESKENGFLIMKNTAGYRRYF